MQKLTVLFFLFVFSQLPALAQNFEIVKAKMDAHGEVLGKVKDWLLDAQVSNLKDRANKKLAAQCRYVSNNKDIYEKEGGLCFVPIYEFPGNGIKALGQIETYGTDKTPQDVLFAQSQDKRAGLWSAPPGNNMVLDMDNSYYVWLKADSDGTVYQNEIEYKEVQRALGNDLNAIAIRFQKKNKPPGTSIWRCYYRNHDHSDPSDCDKPEYGGVWR
jgi:hypothetical protein